MHGAFHSPSDDRYSLDTPGYISIVLPRFGRDGSAAWHELWAFHECMASGMFRRLEPEEVLRRFEVDTARPVTVDIVEA